MAQPEKSAKPKRKPAQSKKSAQGPTAGSLKHSAPPVDKRPMLAPRRPDAARFEQGRPKGKKQKRGS